jgi:uncharacterized membrane protein (DUF2068 family)
MLQVGRGVGDMGSAVEIKKVGEAGGERAGEAGGKRTGVASEHKTGAVHKRVARHHDSGLLLIGLFKLAEAVFFLLVGAGAIHFIHHDLGDAAVRLAERLRIDPDGRLVSYVIDHLDAITAQRMKQIGLATFFYAGLRTTEGIGLVMEQVWAEYLTVGVTTMFLPWEVYAIARHPDWLRVCLLLANLIVLAYLVWWLGRSRRTRTSSAAD